MKEGKAVKTWKRVDSPRPSTHTMNILVLLNRSECTGMELQECACLVGGMAPQFQYVIIRSFHYPFVCFMHEDDEVHLPKLWFHNCHANIYRENDMFSKCKYYSFLYLHNFMQISKLSKILYAFIFSLVMLFFDCFKNSFYLLTLQEFGQLSLTPKWRAIDMCALYTKQD